MATHVSPTEPEVRSDSLPVSKPSTYEGTDGDMSLLDLLNTLVERKHIVLGCTAGFAVLAIIVSLILPKRYTAMVTLLPPQQNSSLGNAFASQMGSFGGVAALAGRSLGVGDPNERLVGMLKSRTVEDAMVQRFGLMQEYRVRKRSDARKAFERHAKVDGTGKDGLIRISMEDQNADRAAQMANGYVEEFQKLSEHLAITEAAQRRLFFEQQLEQAKNKLADAEESLKRTEQTTGLIQVDSQARALIESAASLRAEIVAKEVQIQAMQTYATEENAQLVQAEKELDGLRSQLAKLAGSGETSDANLIVPKGKVPQAGLEYVRKLRDVKYYETMFDILARQFELAKLDEARQGALIQVVDSAVPPDWRSFPNRSLIVVVATVVGFLIGIFAALTQAGFEQLEIDPYAGPKLAHLRYALFHRRRRHSSKPL